MASRADPPPAIEHDSAWQVIVLVDDRVVRESCEPAFQAALAEPERAFAALFESPTEIDGWIVHARERDGVVAMIAARPGDHEALVPAYVDALVDAYAPPEPVPACPPDRRGGGRGGSGAPALIAAYTPPRSVN